MQTIDEGTCEESEDHSGSELSTVEEGASTSVKGNEKGKVSALHTVLFGKLCVTFAPMQKSTVKKKVQKRNETVYCANLRDAMRNNLPLRANRRGVIFNSEGERPSFAIDELFRYRRMGLSYKQIGKKLGIDPDRENVIRVYKALCEEAEELPSIEDIDAPSKVTPPTPLWYMFDSKLEAIAQTALPNPIDVKKVKP